MLHRQNVAILSGDAMLICAYRLLGEVPAQLLPQILSTFNVNITLGLPIIRVSVVHGTAFDQAGTGTASELSLRNSIEYAVMFAENRK